MSTTSDATLNHGIVAYYKNNPVFLKYLNTDIKYFTVTDEIILEFKQVIIQPMKSSVLMFSFNMHRYPLNEL